MSQATNVNPFAFVTVAMDEVSEIFAQRTDACALELVQEVLDSTQLGQPGCRLVIQLYTLAEHVFMTWGYEDETLPQLHWLVARSLHLTNQYLAAEGKPKVTMVALLASRLNG